MCLHTREQLHTHIHTKEKGEKTKLPTGNMREKDTSFYIQTLVFLFLASNAYATLYFTVYLQYIEHNLKHI